MNILASLKFKIALVCIFLAILNVNAEPEFDCDTFISEIAQSEPSLEIDRLESSEKDSKQRNNNILSCIHFILKSMDLSNQGSFEIDSEKDKRRVKQFWKRRVGSQKKFWKRNPML